MYTVVLTLHILLAFVLVILVLLQQGKGADAGAIMGAGGANTVFGVGGASSMLVRMTTCIALLFMLTSVGLVKLAMVDGGRGGSRGDPLAGSVMGSVGQVPAQPAAIPGQPAAGQEQKTEGQPPAAVDGASVPK